MGIARNKKKHELCTPKIYDFSVLMKTIIRIIMMTAICVGCQLSLEAQQLGIWYDTELQTDFEGNYNHVNLLYLSADYSLSNHVKLNAATISIARIRGKYGNRRTG